MLYVENFLGYGWNILEWLLRVVVATLCGAIIGFERSKRFKEAGVRTHSIVALAAAVFMLVSKYAFVDMLGGAFGAKDADPSRIASTIVTGIGFLGAGAIFRTTGNYIKGLTTAAGIFATAAVGMAIGGGLYVIGVVATLMMLFVHFVMHKIHFGRDRAVFCEITFKTKEGSNSYDAILEFAKNNNVALEDEERIKTENSGTEYFFSAKFFGDDAEETIKQIQDLFEKEELLSYSIKRV